MTPAGDQTRRLESGNRGRRSGFKKGVSGGCLHAGQHAGRMKLPPVSPGTSMPGAFGGHQHGKGRRQGRTTVQIGSARPVDGGRGGRAVIAAWVACAAAGSDRSWRTLAIAGRPRLAAGTRIARTTPGPRQRQTLRSSRCQLSDWQTVRTHVGIGSAASVRGPPPDAVVGLNPGPVGRCLPRTAAVAVADLPAGVREGQVPTQTGRSFKNPPPASMGRRRQFDCLARTFAWQSPDLSKSRRSSLAAATDHGVERQKRSSTSPANRSFRPATTDAGRARYLSSVPVPRSIQSSSRASYTGRQSSPWRSSSAGLGR